jgi:hypothetical protein
MDSTLRIVGTALVCALFIANAAAQGRADETEAAIRAAQRAYRAGQLIDAQQRLDKASELIAAAAAKKLQGFLPEGRNGWTAEENAAEAPQLGMTATRSFSKNGKRVTISISGDVRVLAEMAFMALNAAEAKEAGARMVKIKGNSGIVTTDGQIQVLVANRFLVIAEGDAPEDVKTSFLEGIDVNALSRL